MDSNNTNNIDSTNVISTNDVTTNNTNDVITTNNSDTIGGVNPYVNNGNDHYKFFAKLFDVVKEETPREITDDDDDDDDDDDSDNNDNDNNDNDINDNNDNNNDNNDNDNTIDADTNTTTNTTTTNTTSMFTINHVIDAITIQRVYRGRLGRKKRDRTKVIRYRENLQARYSSSEGLYRFYFEQNGAASRIQQWYRHLPWLLKKKWNAKYAKNIEKQKIVKLQRKKDKIYNRKLAALAFLDGSYDDIHNNNDLISFSTILTRFARGHVIRSKIRNMKIKTAKSIIIQSAIRSFLVHCRLPKLGARTRMRIRKEKKWKIDSQIVYPLHLKRRFGIFFPHLKIGNEKNIDVMEKKVLILNRAWRAYKVRRRFRKIQEEKKIRRAIRIQRWYITIR